MEKGLGESAHTSDFIACRVQIPEETSIKLFPLLLGAANYEIKLGIRTDMNDPQTEDDLDRWMRDCVASTTSKRDMAISASRNAIKNIFEKIDNYDKASGKTQEQLAETVRLKLEILRRQEEAIKGVNINETKTSAGFGTDGIRGWLKAWGGKGSKDRLG